MKKFLVSIALGAIVASSLTGCGKASTIVPNTVLSIGESALASNLNAGVSGSTQTVTSNNDLFELTQSGFYSLDNSGNLVANELFGVAKVTDASATNFTVSYTIETGVSWSDSQPISAADLLVSWAAARFADKYDFNSNAAKSGLAYATKTPTISGEGQTLTVVFDQPVADWQTALKLTVPAHLIGKLALGAADEVAAVKAVTDAISSADKTALKNLAKSFNSDWKLTSEEINKELVFSSGAYEVTSLTNGSAVLKATDRCTWCLPPKVETVKLKFYNSTDALLAGMTAGEVDLAKPMESGNTTIATIVPAVEALAESGYKYTAVPSGRIEALFLSYRSDGVFGKKSDYGKKTAVKIRDAFLKLVPRQRILDAVSIPVKLTRADSFVYSSTSKFYTATTQNNGSAQYRIQDVEKASELMSGIDKFLGVKINMVFNPNNFREAIVYNLIAQNAKDANFALLNKSSDAYERVIRKGRFNVYVSEVSLLSADPSSMAKLLNQSSQFKSATAATLINSIAADPDGKQSSQNYADLDKALFDGGYGLPLYELPAVIVFNSKLKYYQPPTHIQSVVAGYADWNVEPEKTK